MKIQKWPAEILQRKAAATPLGMECDKLVAEMFEVMDYPRGIGLAAPQVGENMRIIAIQVPGPKGNYVKRAFINPVVICQRGRMVFGTEGCLSFPGKKVRVPRYPRIKITGFDEHWNAVVFSGSRLVARVLQHELDHLDGITLNTYLQIAKEKAEMETTS